MPLSFPRRRWHVGFLDFFSVLGLFLVGPLVAWAIGWVLEKMQAPKRPAPA